jgi:hypothetical protein
VAGHPAIRPTGFNAALCPTKIFLNAMVFIENVADAVSVNGFVN